MEKRYKMFLMNNKTYEIDQADLDKLTANSEKMLVKLKQVIVHPTSIIAIEPFVVPERRIAIESTGGKEQGMRITTEKPIPLSDLFGPELKRIGKSHE